MQRLFSLLLSLLWCQVALANLFYCPNKMRYINIGDTIAHVEQACGKPTNQATRTEPAKKTVRVQQWFYTIGSPFVGSSRIDVIFVTQNEKVKSIQLNNHEVNSTTLCEAGQSVSVGDSVNHLEATCDTPKFINRTTEKIPTGRRLQKIYYEYNFGAYQPKVLLIFENGFLSSIKPE